jgi:hypothetical protein
MDSACDRKKHSKRRMYYVKKMCNIFMHGYRSVALIAKTLAQATGVLLGPAFTPIKLVTFTHIK